MPIWEYKRIISVILSYIQFALCRFGEISKIKEVEK